MFSRYLLAGCVLCLAALPALSDEKVFRAGAAKCDVTPWLGLSLSGHMEDRIANDVHDALYARCLALDNGQERLAIVLVDNCMIPREVFGQAKLLVKKRDSLPLDHMLMAATHTHSGPCTTGIFQSNPNARYNAFLVRRIADSISCALRNLEPAHIAWGAGSVPDQVFNRRWKMKPGSIAPDPFGGTTDVVKMNPPRASADLVEPAGPTDPELPVLAVQALDGRPIAVLANYGLHYVGANGAEISADYFGMFAAELEARLGLADARPPFVAMLSNGTSGDVNNINFREVGTPQGPYQQTRFVAHRVAEEALRVYQELEYHDWVELGAAQQELELGVRLPTAEEVKRAKETIAKAVGPVMKTIEEIYARETFLLSKYPPKKKLLVQALRIGDVGIAAMPCEVFAEFGLELKQKSAFPRTITIELANGYNGYLPTAQQHEWGGYETWRARSSYLEPQAGHIMVSKLLELFAQLK
ncbi:MAG: neutral/alkaline non-lysosomal ceramidase N-terminal domain-containing protein [Candidatus Hydrogenedentes bacterium]|nr:neutral/alkaline non-lysosomal ceramidase N-terminal domain-containing protein [Candidatus Hydrogenedentota bacterium]